MSQALTIPTGQQKWCIADGFSKTAKVIHPMVGLLGIHCGSDQATQNRLREIQISPSKIKGFKAHPVAAFWELYCRGLLAARGVMLKKENPDPCEVGAVY